MSTAQSSSGFAADAPRYGAEPVAAYYQLNQTGQTSTVETVNGLTGQVVVQLNGTPVVPSGQNINIVAAGLTGITAASNTSTGTVPLTSTDGSIVYTNAGGANAAINLRSVIPSSRVLYVATSSPVQIVGASPFVPPTTSLLDLSGLTVGKSYILNIFAYYLIDNGVNIAAGTSSSQYLRLGVNAAAAPYIAGSTDAYTRLSSILYADINAIGALTNGSTNFYYAIQTSAVITATATSAGIYINSAGSTTTGTVTFNGFMQAVQID